METADRIDSDERLRELIAALASLDPVARERSREALVAAGTCAVTRALVIELSDPRRRVRWEAAKALAVIADPISAPALVDALDDDDDDVRWIAAEGLVAMGREGLLTVLGGLIKRAQSLAFCRGAHHVLHDLGHIRCPQKRLNSAAIAPVLNALEQTEPAMMAPAAAMKALRLLKVGD